MLARGVIRSEVTTKRVAQQLIFNRHLAPAAASSSSSILRQGFHTNCKASFAHYGRPDDQIDHQQEYDNSQSYDMPPKRRQWEHQGGEGMEGGSSEKRSKPSHELRGEMGKKLLDESGNPFWEIGGRLRRVTVSEYNGSHLLGIREHFETGGKILPGKKGISLSMDQLNTMISILPQIEEHLSEVGVVLSRPEYKDKQAPTDAEQPAEQAEEAKQEQQ